MTYTPNMNSMTPSASAYKIDQRDIERILNRLIASQSRGVSSNYTPLVGSQDTTNNGQFAFAYRLAQITKKHAARHKAKFCWKHHSIGLLRRLALVVMVASILSVQYI